MLLRLKMKLAAAKVSPRNFEEHTTVIVVGALTKSKQSFEENLRANQVMMAVTLRVKWFGLLLQLTRQPSRSGH